MSAPWLCPRCGERARPPGPYVSVWRCAAHGIIEPVQVIASVSDDAVRHVVARAGTPCWYPAPLPTGWELSGFVLAGDERSAARAAASGCAGPGPLGGSAEMVVVAEEPGVGLGAGYAGLQEVDPGPQIGGIRAGTVLIRGHPAALWSVAAAPGRAAMVGEADGRWLWIVVWPSSAGYVLAEDLQLADLRGVTGPGRLDRGESAGAAAAATAAAGGAGGSRRRPTHLTPGHRPLRTSG